MTDARAVDLVFHALNDPTRRRLLELLRGGERSVGNLTEAMPVTQGAVSQHLKVLLSAALVQVRPQGTRRLYAITPDGLGPVRAWLDSFWDDALVAFTEHVERRGATR